MIVILAGRNGSIDVGERRSASAAGIARRLRLRALDRRHASAAARKRRIEERAMESELDLRSDESRSLKMLRKVTPHAVHGDLEDAAQTAQHIVALARLAPAKPRIGA